METIIKINNQTAGRDKIARCIQYFSKYVWYKLQQNGNTNSVSTFKNLEFQLGTFRRLLRFGRCFESLYAAWPVSHHPDPTVRYTVVLSKIYNCLFLLADHFVWLGRADVCHVNLDRWGRFANRYWLYSILMNLLRDFYEILSILRQSKDNIFPKGGCTRPMQILEILRNCVVTLQCNRNILIDTVKNSCDFFIPLTALGYIKLSPGSVGLIGVVSSLAALLVLVQPKYKLSPS